MSYVDDAIEALNHELPGLYPAAARLYTLLVLTKGLDTTLPDVHDAWGIWRCRTVPGHPAILPFRQLPPRLIAAELDERFLGGIHATAYKLSKRSGGLGR